MAKMIPNIISRDTLSEGEKQVFYKLQDEILSEEWIVLHSLDIANHGWRFKGEADFVILIPYLGVMVVEVKGCNYIRRDPEKGWFYSKRGLPDKRGPFKQAEQASRSILEYVKEKNKRIKSVPFFHCVLFTHLNIVDHQIDSTEWNKWEWYDKEKIDNVGVSQLLFNSMEKNIEKMQRNSTRRYHFIKPSSFNGAVIDELTQNLRPEFEFYEHPNIKKRRWNKNIVYYTEQQFKALDIIYDQVFFSGPAGTGKTLLACETARRGVFLGYNTLFLCYNKNILYWLKSILSGLQIKVESINKYLLDLSELNLQKIKMNKDFWDSTLPRFVENKLDKTKINKYDLIVIDEAQDIVFNKQYMKIIDMLLKDGISKGKIRMFGDPQYQQIYFRNNSNKVDFMNIEEAIGSKVPIYPLNENCRNTFPIGKYTEFLGSAVGCYTKYLRKGAYEKPLLKYYNNDIEQYKLLNKILKSLLLKGYHCNDIIVLSPFANSIAYRYKSVTNLTYSFRELDNSGLKSLINKKTDKPNNIYFTTIHSFKGLESCIVILTDIDKLNHLSVLYTGMSRAQNKLFILAKDMMINSINKKLKNLI